MLEIKSWDAAPKMSAGAPTPAILSEDQHLWVAYRTSEPPDRFAVLEFQRVERYTLGPPNDEVLHTHPLYAHGLEYYEVQEVVRGSGDSRSWIVTFHDETLEVHAREIHVRVSGVRAVSGGDAILAVRAGAI